MLFAIALLGLMNGCRTMMPMAVLCWFLYFGQLHVENTWAFWAAKLVTAIVFSMLAVAELIGDKLPWIPSRTAIMPLVARMVFGGLVAAIVTAGRHSSLVVILGPVCALAGAYLGYYIRRWLVVNRKLPDFAVALAEDAVVICVSIAALHMLSV